MTFGGGDGGRSPEGWAIGLSLAWLALAAAGWALLGPETMLAAAALLPVGLIWLAAAQARGAGRAERDQARLRGEIDALRSDLRALARGRAAEERPPAEPRPAEPEAEPRADPRTEPQAGPRRAEAAPAAEEDRAPSPARPPLDPAILVRALDFPEDAQDAEGFAALRRALADPQARRLVQASQDVLTLLSQNGVYMDDLEARSAPPALWRRFAGGVRGPGVGALAGVEDEPALELASTRMARDTVFRDAAQHFLRQFDIGLQRFVAHASDEEIEALARTRTAMAFMLLARAARVFD